MFHVIFIDKDGCPGFLSREMTNDECLEFIAGQIGYGVNEDEFQGEGIPCLDGRYFIIAQD